MDNSNGFGYGNLAIATSILKVNEEEYSGNKRRLSEAEKEELMNRYKDADSSEEAERILEKEVPACDREEFIQ